MHSKLLCSSAALVTLTDSGACGSSGPAPIPVARGSASASWSITTAGNVTTCARAGAAAVSLTLHNRTSGDDSRTSFACTDTHATTPPLPVGTYDATLALRSADGDVMTTAPMQAITIAADQVTALQPVTFAVDEQGILVLSLAPLRTTPTCLPRGQGGQGITGHFITLTHAAGGCAAATFKRMRGSTQTGTYTVNCSAPQVTACIERDETLQALSIAPGPYAITVSALTGLLQCGSGEDVVLVPGSVTATKPIQIEPVRDFGC